MQKLQISGFRSTDLFFPGRYGDTVFFDFTLEGFKIDIQDSGGLGFVALGPNKRFSDNVGLKFRNGFGEVFSNRNIVNLNGSVS